MVSPAPSPVEIIGRSGELDVVDRFLDEAALGFAVLRIHGEPGIGKSTIWRESVRRARTRGFIVLSCGPGEGEARISLTGVGDLLEHVSADVLATLPGPQRHAIEVALLRADPLGPPVSERALATAVRSVIARLAEDAPVLVAIDDVQWLDASSAAVLAFAARRLGGVRVGLLAAHRAGTAEPLAIDRLDPAARHLLDIGPLSVGALHHLVKGHLGQTLPRSTLVRVHEAAGGNALFALEITRTLLTTGVPPPGERLPVPVTVREMIAARIAALPEPTRHTLLAAAIAGPADATELATLLGRSVQDDLRLAEGQGIIHASSAAIGFTHPLFPGAIHAAAAPGDRRDVHRALAAAAIDLESRARHLALAAQGPDAAVARMLEEAALEAAARGARSSSAELLDLAWRATPESEPEARLRREIQHAVLVHDVGDTGRARDLLEQVAAAAPPGPIRARALLELAKLVSAIGTESDARERCEAALREAHGDARLSAEAQAVLARLAPDAETGWARAVAAVELLDASDDPDPEALQHALVALCGWELDSGRTRAPRPELVDRALAVERRAPLRRVEDRFSAAMGAWLRHTDDLAGARRWLDATLRAAIDEGDDGSVPYALSHLAQLELSVGRWEEAEELARRHVEVAELAGQEVHRTLALSNLAAVHVHQGRVAAARSEIDASLLVAVETGDTWVEALVRAALGLLELSRGDAEAAVAALEGAREAWQARGDVNPRRYESDLVEALVAVGRVDAARRLADDFESRARRHDRPTLLALAARARALVASAAGDGDAALEALADALVHHDAVPIPFDRARTLLALGIVRRRRRDRGRARDAFLEALEIFEELGARLWIERTRGELDRLGLRRSSGDELTEGERRVAELAATGITNREIAAALFMSPKTVDANLGRVYRKLGIGSRAELGAWAAGRQT